MTQMTSTENASPKGKVADKKKETKDPKQFFKTEFCKFFPECAKGKECPFAHAEVELKERPNLAKTTLCSDWRRGRCQLDSASCKFAHGPWELRAPTPSAGPDASISASKSRRRRIRRAIAEANGGISRQVSQGDERLSLGSSGTATQVPSMESLPPHQVASLESLPAMSGWSRQCSPMAPGVQVASLDSLPTMSGWSRQVSPAVQGVQVASLESLPTMSGWSRQVSPEDDLNDFEGGISRQVSSKSCDDFACAAGSMNRQVSTMSAPGCFNMQSRNQSNEKPVAPTMAQQVMLQPGQQVAILQVQVPVVVNMGTVRMTTIPELAREAIADTQMSIAKILRDAMPEYYEE